MLLMGSMYISNVDAVDFLEIHVSATSSSPINNYSIISALKFACIYMHIELENNHTSTISHSYLTTYSSVSICAFWAAVSASMLHSLH